jgi:hypothetical protein
MRCTSGNCGCAGSRLRYTALENAVCAWLKVAVQLEVRIAWSHQTKDPSSLEKGSRSSVAQWIRIDKLVLVNQDQ